MREYINHPVHVFDKNGYLTPSAFIPMCKFGFGVDLEDFETKLEDVSFPVCNSFKPVMHFDQVCYEVDLENKFSQKNGDLLRYFTQVGIILVLDYNEDQQIGMNAELKDKKATIYFNTKSTKNLNFVRGKNHLMF